MGRLAIPGTDPNYFTTQLAVEGQWKGFGWRAMVEGQDTRSHTAGRVAIGFSKAF
jgi:hypothetical protein